MNRDEGPQGASRATPGRSERWGLLAAFVGASFYLWVAVWLLLFVGVPALLLGSQPVVISSDSMAPAVRSGDVVLLRAAPDEPLAPGTVIAFEDPARGDELTLHRVVGVNADGTYRTKGDANAVADSTPLEADRVVGVGRLLVPIVGLPPHWLRSSPVLFTCWAVATLAAIVLATDPPERRAARATPRLGLRALGDRAAARLVAATRWAQHRLGTIPGGVRVGRVWADDADVARRRGPVRRPLRELTPPIVALLLPFVAVRGRLGALLGVLLAVTVLLVDPHGPELRVGRWRRSAAVQVRHALLVATNLGAGGMAALSLALVGALLLSSGVRTWTAEGAFTAAESNIGNAWFAGTWEPAPTPTTEPTAEPTPTPTTEPTAEPTPTPTTEPTAEPCPTTTHPVSADTYVHAQYSTTNFGGDPRLLVRTHTGNREGRVLLAFEALGVHAGCSIGSATLTIHLDETNAPDTRTIEVHRLAAAFDEFTTTWSNAPGSSGSSTSFSMAITPTPRSISVPVTALMPAAGETPYLMLQEGAVGTHVEHWFRSREHPSGPAAVLTVVWQ